VGIVTIVNSVFGVFFGVSFVWSFIMPPYTVSNKQLKSDLKTLLTEKLGRELSARIQQIALNDFMIIDIYETDLETPVYTDLETPVYSACDSHVWK
jgi:hypothetical protein